MMLGSVDREGIEARQLIHDFLPATEALPREKVAVIAGVSSVAVRRWAVSPPGQMRGDVRERLLQYLAREEMD
jgi:hypothetical protein